MRCISTRTSAIAELRDDGSESQPAWSEVQEVDHQRRPERHVHRGHPNSNGAWPRGAPGVNYIPRRRRDARPQNPEDRKPANTKSKEKSKDKSTVVRSSIVNEYKITR